MYSKVCAAAIFGIEAYLVDVEADVSDGLPGFEMVGYLSSEVREAKERVRTSIKNSGYRIPPKKITINLSPADVRKEGSIFDLSIAIAVLASLGIVQKADLEGVLLVGELSLDGTVRQVKGILAIVELAKRNKISRCIVPLENGREGAIISGIEVVGVSTLEEALDVLKFPERAQIELFEWVHNHWNFEKDASLDFSNVKGQKLAKRASEIAAAGFHNILYIGPPGSGKSMLAKRLPTILPNPSNEECVEISKIYSICGLLSKEDPFLSLRPFRSPHHSISITALAGGGKRPKPGELTLSNRGVLFLDELSEFKKEVLAAMRQPMEDGEIIISRLKGSYTFPTKFILAAAMNPCSCGYYPDEKKCNCSIADIKRHLSRISRPLLDRIDLCVEVPDLSYEEFQGSEEMEHSISIRQRVERARKIQEKRFEGSGITFNSELSETLVEQYCKLGRKEEVFFADIFKLRGYSMRTYHRILKVTRTIADLAGEDEISMKHLSEALCYRNLDRKYWGREDES